MAAWFGAVMAGGVFFFFILIPGVGAWLVRRRWRRFRAQAMDSLDCPVFRPGSGDAVPHDGACRRFCGVLEAVEDNDRLWLRDNGASVALHAAGCTVYQLPGDTPLDTTAPFAAGVRSLRWERASVLAEGMGVFVCGRLRTEGGLPTFGGTGERPPLVILFDGDARDVLARAIWFGRQRNEFWNDVTPVSLLTGFAGLFALALAGLGYPDLRYLSLVAAVLALVPFAPLMPPGIIGFWFYRRLWTDARLQRARRDITMFRQAVQARWLEREVGVPDGVPDNPLGRRRMRTARIRGTETVAVALLMVGMAANLYILLAVAVKLFSQY